MTGSRHLMVVAGEVSGDMHAASVVQELRRIMPDLKVSGVGGDRLREQGAEILYDAKDMAVIGVSEVIRRYGFFRRVFRDMVQRAKREKPDAVLLIDYPGFNLRYAAKLHAMGIKVLYYVCPQVWAWHRSRVEKMARIVDRLMVIFPFEVDVFSHTSLTVDFVGHPLVEAAREVMDRPDEKLPWSGEPRIAILPGSRRQELERLLPPLLGAAALLEQRKPGASFIIPAVSPAMKGLVDQIVEAHDAKPTHLAVVEGVTRDVLKQADAAWVKSGTSTLEAALMDCPMAVIYKTSALTGQLGKMLVKVDNIGMVNLIAGRELCPEILQNDITPETLAAVLEPLCSDSPERRAMLEGLAGVREKLGSGGAAGNAAAIIAEELGGG